MSNQNNQKYTKNGALRNSKLNYEGEAGIIYASYPLYTTTYYNPNQYKVLGHASTVYVTSLNLLRDIGAGIQKLFGGKQSISMETIQKNKNKVFNDLRRQIAEKNGDMAIGLIFSITTLPNEDIIFNAEATILGKIPQNKRLNQKQSQKHSQKQSQRLNQKRQLLSTIRGI
jgi:uncharacterized protein YbjQ (UPF0145 family)